MAASPSNGVPPAAAFSSTHRSSVTLQQLTAFGMRNIALQGAMSGELMDLYFKLVLDSHVVYVSEVARNTLNPVWMPFEPEELMLRGHGDEPLDHLFAGTRFDIVVVRVRDYQVARRKSRALSGKIMAEEEDGKPTSGLPLTIKEETPEAVAAADAPSSESRDRYSSLDERDTALNYEEEILNVTFHLHDLDALPVRVSEISNLPLNTCLFEFNSRLFVKREVIELLVETGVIAARYTRRKGSAMQLKDYCLHDGVDSLERIQELKQSIDEVTASNHALKDQIRQALTGAEDTVAHDHKRTRLHERIHTLRRQIADKKDAVERVKSVMQDERRTFETDIHIPKALLSTMQMGMKYKDEKQGILERRCEVLRAAHKIRSRQAMLVKELGSVYPIEYVGAGEYAIRGIKIAKSDLSATARADEENVSTALGYIAHLIFMLSKYLHVNLRYRVVPYSSRSCIKDEINDPHGEYPLYRKGVEKERFEQAISFLRKDVEQLQFARGLDPTQGASILRRLADLIDAEVSWLFADRDGNANHAAVV